MTALVFFCAAAATLLPVDEQVGEILDRLEKAASELNSFRADYHQVELDEFGDEFTYKGTIEYLKEGRWRMTLVADDQNNPIEEVVSDGSKGWMIRHKTKKVEVASMSTIRRRAGGITFTGAAGILKRSYRITLKGTEETRSGPAHHLLCMPIKGAEGVDPTIVSLDLWINDEQPAPIAKIRLAQRGGIITTWELSNIQRNLTISEKLFEYRIPRGYEEFIH
jgi:outer membrane lipoprotein-sorting protein